MAAESHWSRWLPSPPLGWLQLWHKPLRLLVAVAGISFAVMLILMQLGFRSALFESTLRFHERFRYDIALFSTESVFIVRPAPFTIRRLYEALGSPDVESVSPVYIFPATWKNPWTNARRSLNAVGIDPTRNVLDTPGFAETCQAGRTGRRAVRSGVAARIRAGGEGMARGRADRHRDQRSLRVRGGPGRDRPVVRYRRYRDHQCRQLAAAVSGPLAQPDPAGPRDAETRRRSDCRRAIACAPTCRGRAGA